MIIMNNWHSCISDNKANVKRENRGFTVDFGRIFTL